MTLTWLDWLLMLVYFALRARRRRRAQAPIDDDQRGVLPGGTGDTGVGLRTGVHLGKPRRAGNHRHGRVGCEVRHLDQPFLLDRRDPGDGVPRRVHDAVLLRLARALGARYLRLRF